MIGLLEWALRVALASIVLLLFALLLQFVWNALMTLFHGPSLPFYSVAIFVALVSIAVGGWSTSLIHARTAQS